MSLRNISEVSENLENDKKKLSLYFCEGGTSGFASAVPLIREIIRNPIFSDTDSDLEIYGNSAGSVAAVTLGVALEVKKKHGLDAALNEIEKIVAEWKLFSEKIPNAGSYKGKWLLHGSATSYSSILQYDLFSSTPVDLLTQPESVSVKIIGSIQGSGIDIENLGLLDNVRKARSVPKSGVDISLLEKMVRHLSSNALKKLEPVVFDLQSDLSKLSDREKRRMIGAIVAGSSSVMGATRGPTLPFGHHAGSELFDGTLVCGAGGFTLDATKEQQKSSGEDRIHIIIAPNKIDVPDSEKETSLSARRNLVNKHTNGRKHVVLDTPKFNNQKKSETGPEFIDRVMSIVEEDSKGLIDSLADRIKGSTKATIESEN